MFDTEDPTFGWVGRTGQGSSEVKLANGEVRRKGRIEYREERWRWRKVKTTEKELKVNIPRHPLCLNLGLNKYGLS